MVVRTCLSALTNDPCDRVPPRGAGAVGQWPAGATAESHGEGRRLSTAVATAVLPGRVGLRDETLTLENTTMTDNKIALRALLEMVASTG